MNRLSVWSAAQHSSSIGRSCRIGAIDRCVGALDDTGAGVGEATLKHKCDHFYNCKCKLLRMDSAPSKRGGSEIQQDSTFTQRAVLVWRSCFFEWCLSLVRLVTATPCTWIHACCVSKADAKATATCRRLLL